MRIAVRPAGKATAKAVLTDAQKARLGPEGRIPIRLQIGGETFRTTLVRMHGEWCFVSNAQMRAAGFTPGEAHVVEIARDEEPRPVVPPPELAAALARDPVAEAAWDGLSRSHRREYAEWIAEAKREETRARRVEETLAALRGG
jgi:hypothetical protein